MLMNTDLILRNANRIIDRFYDGEEYDPDRPIETEADGFRFLVTLLAMLLNNERVIKALEVDSRVVREHSSSN